MRCPHRTQSEHHSMPLRIGGFARILSHPFRVPSLMVDGSPGCAAKRGDPGLWSATTLW